MLQYEEALRTVLEAAKVLKKEKAGLEKALGRVLAEDIVSDVDMPPFNKSAMDGYACRRDDLPNLMNVVEVIAAGQIPGRKIGNGQCAKIMTGARMPVGADCVIMVEHTEEVHKGLIRFTGKTTKNNYVATGEDVRKGEVVLRRGLLIKPQHIAVLAAVGATEIMVHKRLKVGILSTGDELVEPGENPGLSKIRNSNAYQLMAQVVRSGATPSYLGIIKDNPENSEQLIYSALKKFDLVLLTGGVSMGDFDFIPHIMRNLEVEILFQRIAVQPGKPTVFGTWNRKYIFGLPGNPVSSFNIFELLVKPMINRLHGCEETQLNIILEMGTTYTRKKSERLSFLPVSIRDGKVYPVEYHGSAHIHALTSADGLISIPIGTTTVYEGDMIYVRQI